MGGEGREELSPSDRKQRLWGRSGGDTQRRGQDGVAGSFCRQGTGVGGVTDHSGSLLENGAGGEGAEMSLVPRTAHGSALVMRVWKKGECRA